MKRLRSDSLLPADCGLCWRECCAGNGSCLFGGACGGLLSHSYSVIVLSAYRRSVKSSRWDGCGLGMIVVRASVHINA